jgi:hypothetical protein
MSACSETESGSQIPLFPDISILNKLTQIPDVSTRRRACKKKSQRSETHTSSLYETAVKNSVKHKFITGTREGKDAKEHNLLASLQNSRQKKQQLQCQILRTLLATHI